MYFLIILFVVVLSVMCLGYMLYKIFTKQDEYPAPTFKQSIVLAIAGVVSFISDTIGVGSFAPNIAIAKTLKLVKDAELPGFTNGAQIIPGALEAIIFLGVFHVDILTLVVLVLGATFGGFLGGFFASKIHTATIRLIMIFAFMAVIFLLIGNLLNLIPMGGNLMKLSGIKLYLGFVGMFFSGFLVCFGVGLFALVQAVLFLLGMSPIVAFPIMMTAGAIQQPVTTFAFAMNNTIPLRKVLIVGVFGVIGVFIGFNMVTMLSTAQLHCLLIIVISYNTISLVRSYRKSRKDKINCSSKLQLG